MDKLTHYFSWIAEDYYAQRATKGGLIIAEATLISEEAGGLEYSNAPGIWSDAQISRWKQLTDKVHARGGYIYSQLWGK